MTSGVVVIFLPLAVVAGTMYFLWRLGGLQLEEAARGDDAAETPSLLLYRRFEDPWRWGMFIWTLGLMLWVVASLLRLVPFTRWGLLALAVPFASMSLFGLYTGEVTFRDSTVRRGKDPILFWLYFGLDALFAGLILFLVATDGVRP